MDQEDNLIIHSGQESLQMQINKDFLVQGIILKTMEYFLFNMMTSVDILMKFIFVILSKDQNMKSSRFTVIKNMEQFTHLQLKMMMIIQFNYINQA